jgi:AraC-like DNA-binding protein
MARRYGRMRDNRVQLRGTFQRSAELVFEPTIWTIGHSTRPLEEVLGLLEAFNIEAVTDVRRQLLLEARQELAHEYLNRPEMDVTEVASLLGYEDSNPFYRAFRTWEGTTPSRLRAALRRSETRQ